MGWFLSGLVLGILIAIHQARVRARKHQFVSVEWLEYQQRCEREQKARPS